MSNVRMIQASIFVFFIELTIYDLFTDVSLDDTSYFANYDQILKQKRESIVYAVSGSRAVYRSVDSLERILSLYSPSNVPTNEDEIVAKANRSPCWIDIQYPSVETMVLISRAFGIHTLTMEDCLSETEDQHQKNELFDTYRFLSFTEFHYIPYTNVLGCVDVHIIVPEASNILISLHNGPALFMATTLRALASPRNSIGFTTADFFYSGHPHNGAKDMYNGDGDALSGHSKNPSLAVAPGVCRIPSAYWMMYSIMDSIVDRFVQLVATCTNEVEQLDSLVLELPAREQTDLLLRIGEVRKQISLLRLQLMRKQDIIHTIVAEAKDASVIQENIRPLAPTSSSATLTPSVSAATVQYPHSTSPAPVPTPSASPSPYASLHSSLVTPPVTLHANRISTIRIFLRDILDHVNSMLYDLEQDKETLLNLTNAYQARVSIEMNLAAAEQNRVMKKFSAMATIILPLTFVPSLWGMNVPVPGQEASSTWVFWTIVGSLVGVGILASIVFWRIKWL